MEEPRRYILLPTKKDATGHHFKFYTKSNNHFADRHMKFCRNANRRYSQSKPRD